MDFFFRWSYKRVRDVWVTVVKQKFRLASFTLIKPTERNRVMKKTFEAISEALRNPRHPFRKADNQPKKALKNRYERRKIKEYLHIPDWLEEETA